MNRLICLVLIVVFAWSLQSASADPGAVESRGSRPMEGIGGDLAAWQGRWIVTSAERSAGPRRSDERWGMTEIRVTGNKLKLIGMHPESDNADASDDGVLEVNSIGKDPAEFSFGTLVPTFGIYRIIGDELMICCQLPGTEQSERRPSEFKIGSNEGRVLYKLRRASYPAYSQLPFPLPPNAKVGGLDRTSDGRSTRAFLDVGDDTSLEAEDAMINTLRELGILWDLKRSDRHGVVLTFLFKKEISGEAADRIENTSKLLVKQLGSIAMKQGQNTSEVIIHFVNFGGCSARPSLKSYTFRGGYRIETPGGAGESDAARVPPSDVDGDRASQESGRDGGSTGGVGLLLK